MINETMNICICGIGPGHVDYIYKAVFAEVDKAQVLIGGKRQLDIFPHSSAIKCVFDGKTAHLKETIQQNSHLYMVVLVSGDTGFHSLRRFLVDAFPKANIKLLPGISSFQYLYAKLGMGYENALLTSIHGTDVDFINRNNFV